MAQETRGNPPSNTPLRIALWRLHPSLNRLERNGEVVHLEPKAVKVLQMLAERAGEPVTRQELLDGAWPGLVVTDDALTQVIIKLRKALGDNSRAPEYIETIPKRGYRLVAEVSPETPHNVLPAPGFLATYGVPGILSLTVVVLLAWWFLSEPPATPRRGSVPMSVSVAPFESIGDTPSQRNLARGITADLSTDLAKISSLLVIRSSLIESGSGIAGYVVSGSVQRSSDQVQIHVRLMDASTGQQIWSERYKRPTGDLFELQQAISSEIVKQLAVELTSAEYERLAKRYTRNLEAYEFFQRGQSELLLRQKEANRSARDWYRKAINLDPAFSRAYAGIALSFAADFRNQWTDNPNLALEQAYKMAESALQIDSEIPEIHWVLGYVATQKREHEAANSQLERALELDRSYADAYALMGGVSTYNGNPENTIPLLRKAMRLKPDAGYLYFLLLGRAYFFLSDHEQAIINLQHSLVRNPTNIEARLYLAAADLLEQDLDAAAWEVVEIRTLNPDFRLSEWVENYPMTDRAQVNHLIKSLKPLDLW